MKYDIVQHYGPDRFPLIEMVNDKIKEGWEPQGGVSFAQGQYGEKVWAQAVVKKSVTIKKARVKKNV